MKNSPHMTLNGIHVVVTGASRGIGRAIAEDLARQGAHLSLMARDGAALKRVCRELEKRYKTICATHVLDVTKPARVTAAFNSARKKHGPIQILVNNAGAAESAPFQRTTLALWQRMLAVNLSGAFLCSQAVIEEMVAARYGRIINIASTAGITGYSYVTAYCAAKHGLVGLTRSLAREFAHAGVTVNAICPSYTETDLLMNSLHAVAKKTRRPVADLKAEFMRSMPHGRFVEPQEIARLVTWICMQRHSSVNGQAIALDGGETLK